MSNVGLGIQVYSWIAKAFPFYSFFFGLNLRFGGLQSTLIITRVYALANRKFFPWFSSTRRKMWAFKPVLLHVKITRSTNLCSVCRRRLELSTYLNTESYNHINFLNTSWQLVWVLASSGFYWVFNNMKNDDKIRRVQNSFSKTASVHRKPLSLVGVISSVCLKLCGSLVIRPRLPCFHTIK